MVHSSTRPAGRPGTADIPEQSTSEQPQPPLRQSTEIQGDVIAGFKKDHVQLIFAKFKDRRRARTWLRRLSGRIATTKDVAAFNTSFSRARRYAAGEDPVDLAAVWRGVAFTYQGLTELLDGAPLTDIPKGSTQEAFAQGPARRKEIVGDIEDSDPARWLFGGEEQHAIHLVLTLAADRHADLQAALEEERAWMAAQHVAVVFEQEGNTLKEGLRGHEHFGFKDGISQPGVRDFDEEDPGRPDYHRTKPGTRLITPGEFVVGMTPDHRYPAALPRWMRNGSFQVVRRLAQDVPGWWGQIEQNLKVLQEAGAAPKEATKEWVAARMVGRWPSGAPVAKCPDADVAAPPCADSDNDISFADDLDGRTTPLFSHLRKTNPRDGLLPRRDSPTVVEEDGMLDGRRLMRRSIPYGRPYDPQGTPGQRADAPRGLVFICYQSDIAAQFEFVQSTWVNADNFPERRDAVGRDPLIGRDTDVSFPASSDTTTTCPLRFERFVRTEGAVYAFTPSLTALRELAEGRVPVGGDPPSDQVVTGGTALRRLEVISAYKARFRLEGNNYVIRDENEHRLWSSDNTNPAVAGGTFTEDGDLVLNGPRGEAVWSLGTGGHPGATLVVGADGDVSIRTAEGETVWHSDTAH
ncbi:Dyp-type peroxidase [Streptomyces sp. XC 2026]|uniref:Dyp-type peroxidase n=1 Tax=Streptomyces sp. XC 2026 TaxID=2782004 RepID=UPI001906D0A6|nr:Dyp-type peroxidase [Streptomyces sp. XC 2026]QQN76320.1 Dyp-type peroxidase [Streptomyces sp. XC 2026]